MLSSLRYLQELTVRIESLTNLGEGIAREGNTAWVVMIPHVIPGELVKCRVFRNHSNYSEATLVSLGESFVRFRLFLSCRGVVRFAM